MRRLGLFDGYPPPMEEVSPALSLRAGVSRRPVQQLDNRSLSVFAEAEAPDATQDAVRLIRYGAQLVIVRQIALFHLANLAGGAEVITVSDERHADFLCHSERRDVTGGHGGDYPF